jgi:hypothetical protein
MNRFSRISTLEAFDPFNSYSFERRPFLTFSTACTARGANGQSYIAPRRREFDCFTFARCCAVRAIALT